MRVIIVRRKRIVAIRRSSWLAFLYFSTGSAISSSGILPRDVTLRSAGRTKASVPYTSRGIPHSKRLAGGPLSIVPACAILACFCNGDSDC